MQFTSTPVVLFNKSSEMRKKKWSFANEIDKSERLRQDIKMKLI